MILKGSENTLINKNLFNTMDIRNNQQETTEDTENKLDKNEDYENNNVKHVNKHVSSINKNVYKHNNNLKTISLLNNSKIEIEHKKYNKDLNEKTKKDPIVYKLVLTGGPCSGKTTGQVRLSTFFENLGWKVYRVPETASILFSGGIRFSELNKEEADKFQENLLKTMLIIENTFFDIANTCGKNCLLICDRGAMDVGAYMSKEAFNNILKKNSWNQVDLRDNRYNQVIHLITAAKGAEEFYQIEDNPCRTEGIELARKLDSLTIEGWVGHPYIDVIGNNMSFDLKMRNMIECVCRRIGINTQDRLAVGAAKHKFKIKKLPNIKFFPNFQDFDVVHDYLISSNKKYQYRLRKRGQKGKWSYQHTTRRCEGSDQIVELRRQITHRDYMNYLTQKDELHYTIYKTRRCFLWNDKYFQMDIYKSPFHRRCNGLILLETYSTLGGKELFDSIPSFLEVEQETTGNPSYSMYNLSLKAEWNIENFEKKKIKKKILLENESNVEKKI